MAASIGSFSVDAMRGRLAPAPHLSDSKMGLAHKGKLAPETGVITTEKRVTAITDAVTLSASYRAIIGTTQTCVINGTSVSGVVIIDCHTSYLSKASGRLLKAEWKLAAPASWNP